MFPRDMGRDDIADVLSTMAAGQLVVDDLVDRPVSPAEAQRTFDALACREGLTAVFDWQQI